MTIALQDVASAIGAPALAPSPAVSGWSVDSRTIQAGDLFFALRGPNHDGHDFVADVFRRGAGAAVVDRRVDAAGVLLPVNDSLAALQALAAWARNRWGGQVIAVTGSAGKTTTKEIIASFLETEMPAGKSAGNLNNHVGLPLSILRLSDECRAAVLEIAMNHAGEIRRLAGIARPDVGVVTNVGHAHAESFGSIDDIAAAKRELIEALPPDAVAVLNADDPRVSRFREIHTGPVVTFGFAGDADVRAETVEYRQDGARFRLSGSVELETPLTGRHGVMNVLAAVAVARVFGIPPERLRDAARSLAPAKMRGERFTHAGVTVLNDCYNSNPEAVRAMIDSLRDIPARRRCAVLGEMLELGRWSEALHRGVGRYAAESGIHVLVGIRGAARHVIEEAVKAGLPDGAAYFFEDPAEAGDLLRGLLREGDAVLFKGSRGTRVELALERFLK